MCKIKKHECRGGTAAAADYAGGDGLIRAARLRRDNNEAHCRTGPRERGNHFCHFPRTEDLYWAIVEDKVSSNLAERKDWKSDWRPTGMIARRNFFRRRPSESWPRKWSSKHGTSSPYPSS